MRLIQEAFRCTVNGVEVKRMDLVGHAKHLCGTRVHVVIGQPSKISRNLVVPACRL